METVSEILAIKSSMNKPSEAVLLTEGIDIGRLWKMTLSTFRHQIRFIVGWPLVVGVFVFGLSHLLPKSYVSTSYVTMVRSRPVVKTIELEKVSDPGASRDQALLTLAMSGDVIADILSHLEAAGINLKQTDRRPDVFARSMNPAIYGDIVGLTFTWKDRVLVEKITNIWAEVFVKHVNKTYAVNITADNRANVESGYSRALAMFQDINRQWIDFVKSDTTQWLSDEIAEKEKLRDSLLDLRQSRMNERATYVKKSLALAYEQRLILTHRLEEARSLALQIKDEGTGSFGSRLAIISLKSKVFASDLAQDRNGPQIRLEFPALVESPRPTNSSDLTEVQQLVTVISERLNSLTGVIQSLEKSLLEGVGLLDLDKTNSKIPELSNMERAILALKGKMARQEVTRTDLKERLDIATAIFKSKAAQMQEVSVSSNSPGNEVRIASSALPPDRPVSPRPVLNAALAFVLTFALVCFSAFYREASSAANKSM